MKYLINYANEKYRPAQKKNTKSAKKHCSFDEIIEYSSDDVDEEYKKSHLDIFSNPRGDGLWLWKPYLIKKTLSQVNVGDIVFYADSGCCFFKNCDCVFDILKNQDIWVTALPLIEKQYTKKETFRILSMDFDEYGSTNQISGSFMAYKKTEYSVGFVNEWINFCENLECIAPSSDNRLEDKDFISHREDQSILSLLIKKYGIQSYSDPSQFGRYPNGYYGKERVMKYINRTDYKPFILHHRRFDPKFKNLFKCYLMAVLPVNLQNVIWNRRI